MRRRTLLVTIVTSGMFAAITGALAVWMFAGAAKMSAPDTRDVAAAPPPPAASKTSVVSWNAWWEAGERRTPGYVPLERLRPSATATLVLDLARLAYSANGVGSAAASRDLDARIEEVAKDLDVAAHLTLRAVVLFDPRFFHLDGDRVKELDVDVARVSREASPDGAGAGTLADQARAASLGEVLFPLRTRGRTGRTTVAISIWADDAPMDEVHAEVCVGDAATCREPPRLAEESELGLAGYDPARPSVTKPDAAIHLLELGPARPLVGVLRIAEWPKGKLVTWHLEKTAAELAEYVRTTLAPALNASAPVASELEDRALNLQFLLFPVGDEAREARSAFRAFVASHLGGAPVPAARCPADAPTGEVPSIFFRAVPYGESAPLLLPVGLLGAKVDGKVHFLGFHFRFEQPLERQLYRTPGACISRWMLALPPTNDGPLTTAWAIVQDEPPWPKLRERGFKDGAAFRTWAEDEEAAAESALLVLVSHHDHDRLWFRDNEQILSESFRRPFLEPSVAILDGCGTGVISATELIRALNARGVNAAIATQTEVPAPMAGTFLSCLASTGVPPAAQSETLANAYVRSVRCLAQKGNPPYGARALTYSLLGNGTIRLCRPQETP